MRSEDAYAHFGGPFSLPFLGRLGGFSWNARGLFAFDIAKYHNKIKYLEGLARSLSFALLQETHHQQFETRFFEELMGQNFSFFWDAAVGQGRAGGVGVISNKKLLDLFRCHHHAVLEPGRVHLVSLFS